MSYQFSKQSLEKLAQCDLRLQRVFMGVVDYVDCVVLVGHRSKEDQDKAFLEGKSKLHFPKSKHNQIPSLAIDASPKPVNWSQKERFYAFAGFVLGIAATMNINIRWGGDWDRDFDMTDQTFNDLAHFELVDTPNS